MEDNDNSFVADNTPSETKVEPPTPSPAPPRQAAPLVMKDGGFVSNTLEDEYRWARMMIASGMMPQQFKKPEQLIAARQLVREHFPEHSLTALSKIAVINGTPGFFADLPLAIVQKAKTITFKDEFFIDKDQKRISLENKNLTADVWAACCLTKRKYEGSEESSVFTWFSVDDALRAGLLNGKDVWKKYTRKMLKYRARSENLKDNFADALNGMNSEVDLEGVVEDKSRDVTDELNKEYLGDNPNKELIEKEAIQ